MVVSGRDNTRLSVLQTGRKNLRGNKHKGTGALVGCEHELNQDEECYVYEKPRDCHSREERVSLGYIYHYP